MNIRRLLMKLGVEEFKCPNCGEKNSVDVLVVSSTGTSAWKCQSCWIWHNLEEGK